MITIEYSPDGKAFADAEAEEYLVDLVRREKDVRDAFGVLDVDLDLDCVIKVSTENIIYASRVLIKERGYKFKYKFKDVIFEMDKDGRSEYWPDGFCDYFDEWCRRLL